MRRRVVFLLLGLAPALAAPPGAAAQCAGPGIAADQRLGDIDSHVTAVMDEWKVPGLAIAVVADGDIILCKGYGFRDLDERLPVTPRTLFAIGSITKSFTVAVLAMLADEGRLDWDEPVYTYMPGFQLYDDVASRRMTPRDLVTHRSGLPRHDAVWYGSGLTRRELYERLRYLEPSADFRAVFQYQNLMFMTAGYLAGRLVGESWEALVRRRIFEPLNMARSNFSVKDSQRDDDFAYPYARSGGHPDSGQAEDRAEARQIAFRDIDEIGPAGSINSSVEEMIRYVRLHLRAGEYEGQRLLSEAAAREMQTPQMVIREPVQYAELGHTAYGLGFFVTSYRGEKLVHHGGGIDGFIALLSFLPDRELGMIVLTNQSSDNPVPTIVTRTIYDRLLGAEPVDWAERAREAQRRVRAAEQEATKQVEGTSPSHPLADYAGRYEHPAYGTISITLTDGALQGEYHGETVALRHYHYDLFEVVEDPRNPLGGIRLMFLYDRAGTIDRVAVTLEPALEGGISFRRVVPEGAGPAETGGSGEAGR